MNALQEFEQKLGTIADAIRTKKGTTDKIPAENIENEILSIESGGGSGGNAKQFTAGIVSSKSGIKATIPTAIMNKKQFSASMALVIE